MKLIAWLIAIVYIFLFSFAKLSEATLSINWIRKIGLRPFIPTYGGFFSEIYLKNSLNLLTVKDTPTRNDGNLEEIDFIQYSFTNLSDNSGLALGDALLNTEGDLYFFMAPKKDDSIMSTLICALSGECASNHRITDYFVVKKYNRANVEYLEYSEDPCINDKFKVIQVYEGYKLLGSFKHNFVFVAPIEGIYEFIRNEFQSRMSKQSNKLVKRQESQNKKIVESSVGKPESADDGIIVPLSSRKYSESEYYQGSPDSVVYGSILREISPIAGLFGRLEVPTELRIKFIKERFLSILTKMRSELNFNDAILIARTAESIFKEEKTIGYINVTDDQRITVVGDIHGQFYDLFRIINEFGLPSAKQIYLFNGDIVDRGSSSIECLLLLYVLKITFPRSVYINRGNHESRMCSPGTFATDCFEFDGSGHLHQVFQSGFAALPIAHVINSRIYVVHGGIRADYGIKDISEYERLEMSEEMESFLYTSLWDDPSEEDGITENPSRGPTARKFGPDVTAAFLQLNDFDLLIRSHTFTESGIKASHGSKCITVFSAPNYCESGNVAGVISYNSELVPTYYYFKSE